MGVSGSTEPKDVLEGLQRNYWLREESWEDQEDRTINEIGKTARNWAKRMKIFRTAYYSGNI